MFHVLVQEEDERRTGLTESLVSKFSGILFLCLVLSFWYLYHL